MRLVKLTNREKYTRAEHDNRLRWGENVTHEVAWDLRSKAPCSPGVIHAYQDPLLAVMMDPSHANYISSDIDPMYNGLVWNAEGDPVVINPDKVCCWHLKTLEIIARPAISIAQRRLFATFIYDDLSNEAFVREEPSIATAPARSLAACAAARVARAIKGGTSFDVSEAAIYAARAKPTIDLVALAHRAVEEKP